MTYNHLNTLLQGRCYHKRKIANNTWAIRHPDSIAIRLHSTDILTFTPDGNVRYSTGVRTSCNGWRTVTTKSRMNTYGPARIYQHKHTWFISYNGMVEEYHDGITFQPENAQKTTITT